MKLGRLTAYAAVVACLATGASAGLAADHAGHQPATPDHGSAAPEAKGHSHEACELHGGQVAMTKAHHFETVFGEDGVRVYRYSGAQKPELIGSAGGAVTLKFKNGTSRTVPFVARAADAKGGDVFFCTMHPDQMKREPGACPVCNMKLVAQSHLFAAVDLRKVEPGTLKASISIKGLGGDETEAAFTETFQGAAHHGDHD
jgi:hypothetical protein